MPRCRVTRRLHFNAAHRLYNPEFSEEWNRATFGKCANANFHGHNYELDVTVTGAISDETGEVMDLARLRDLVEREVVSVLDHRNLNVDVAWFRDLIPTAENIAVCIWRALRPAIPPEFALAVRLWETPRNYVDYAGD
jgi:6-pyruvoyltetrahydropterin/6-carboxytetrahydropterin synthase